MNISSTKHLRQINRDKVMDTFMELESCTKNQLSLATGLSLATINNILKDLLLSKEVFLGEELESTGGRKSRSYCLNSDYSRILAISLNKEYRRVHIIYRVYNLTNEIIYYDEVIKKEVNINDIYDIINIVIAKFNNIKVIGLSVPGIINEGRVTSTGLENFDNVELVSLLENKYKQKIILGNDVNTAVIGFYLNERDYENVCLLFQPGEGYAGVGIVINGQLVLGKTNCAGEVQYLPLNGVAKSEYLSTPEGTIELLSKYIVSLTAIINPEIVAISCSNLERAEDLQDTLKQMIPMDYLPFIKKVDNLYDYILIGLQLICKDSLKTSFTKKLPMY